MLQKILFGEAHGSTRFLIIVFISSIWAFVGVSILEVPPTLSSIIWEAFRYSSVPLLALIGAFVAGSFYIKDIYELEDYRAAVSFMRVSILEIFFPTLKISNGSKEIKDDDISTLDCIGGPGFLKIEPGNIVVLERLQSPSDVLGAGKYPISRFETIKAIFSLQDYYGKIEDFSAVTKDGIKVIVSGVEYGFRFSSINKNSTSRRLSSNPYPFSARAAIDIVYNRVVGDKGQPSPWKNSVQGAIRGTIIGHIKRTQLDYLIVSTPLKANSRKAHVLSETYVENSPLDALHEKLNSPEMRKRLRGMGAELLWCGIGRLDLDFLDVNEQRLEKWLIKWTGNTKVIQAQGEAEGLASQERGRAEGQVDLLKSISQALKEVNMGTNSERNNIDKNLRNIVLARTAQVIEAMTSIYETPEEINREKKGEH